MFSLHKHSSGRSPYWFAKYKAADGRIVVKSTRQEKKEDATDVALGWLRAEELARKGKLTEARARTIISQICERVTGQALNDLSIEEFLKEWLRGKELSKAEKTISRYENTVAHFLRHLGKRSKQALSDLSAHDLETFRDAMVKAGRAPSTVKLMRS